MLPGTTESSDNALIAALIPLVGEAFAASIVAVPPVPLSEDAYNASRQQYHSTILLDALVSHKRAEWSRLLGIADVDLYTPDLNFVFGKRMPIAASQSFRLRDFTRPIAHASYIARQLRQSTSWGTPMVCSTAVIPGASCGSRTRWTRVTGRAHASAGLMPANCDGRSIDARAETGSWLRVRDH
jgi:hypothetical protein